MRKKEQLAALFRKRKSRNYFKVAKAKTSQCSKIVLGAPHCSVGRASEWSI